MNRSSHRALEKCSKEIRYEIPTAGPHNERFLCWSDDCWKDERFLSFSLRICWPSIFPLQCERYMAKGCLFCGEGSVWSRKHLRDRDPAPAVRHEEPLSQLYAWQRRRKPCRKTFFSHSFGVLSLLFAWRWPTLCTLLSVTSTLHEW